jgi:Excalibur calcium-binding domain
MAQRNFPNFRRAQRDRGPFYRGRRAPTVSGLSFGPIVALSSAALFGAVLFYDRVPSAIDAVVKASRDLGRERVPQLGDYYSGCDDARAARAAPLYRGEPGYRPEMDGDRDGIACEPYRSY